MIFSATVLAGLPGWIRNHSFSLLLSLCMFLAGCSSDLRQTAHDGPGFVFNAIRSQIRRGEFSDALQNVKRANAEWQSHPEAKWHWKFKLLFAELLLFNGDTGQAEELIATPPPAMFSDLMPRYQMLHGYAAYRKGSNAQAELILASAAKNAHAASDFELEADTELILATYASPDQSDVQVKLIERLLAFTAKRGLKYQLAAAWLDYGMLRVRQSRFAEAIALFERGSQAAEEAGAPLLASLAVGNMASCYYSLGDFDQALAMRQKAIAVQARAGLKTALRDSYLELGTTQSFRGDTVAGIRSLRQALSLVNAADSPESYSTIACTLASALETTGSLEEAEHLNRQAGEVSHGDYATINATVIINEAVFAERRGEYDVALNGYLKAIELSSGNPSLLWSAYAGAGSVYARFGKLREARQNFEAAIRTISANRAEQLQSKYQITFLSRLISLYQEYVEMLIQSGDEAHALDIADSSRAAVLADNAFGEERHPSRDLAATLRKLAEDTGSTFLFYWLAPKRSYVWVLSREGLKTIPLEDARLIADRVKSYRYLVEQEKIDPLAASSQLPSQLFQELVAPALAAIPKGTSVVIVPDGILHSLNFESLVVAQPLPHYWLEDVTISIAPSLRLLKTTIPSRSGPSGRSLFLVGNPDMTGTGYTPLLNAGAEMDRVGGHFAPDATTVRRGREAFPAAYREARPQRFFAIHFATHAEANQLSPLDSAIILSAQNGGFRLYARDIMELPITADLVTISGCRGANARTLSGEGAVGFAWAFFKAGARHVVAGLWDVNDQSTADLMDLFYANVSRGMPFPAALQRSKLAMLQTRFRKPYYWAPFQLYSRTLSSSRN